MKSPGAGSEKRGSRQSVEGPQRETKEWPGKQKEPQVNVISEKFKRRLLFKENKVVKSKC